MIGKLYMENLSVKDLGIFQVLHITAFCLTNLYFVPILNLET